MEQPSMLDVNPTVRRVDDFYPTPGYMTRALLARLPSLRGLRVLEPCVGDGAIVRQLPQSADVVTNDIVPRGDWLPDFLLDATHLGSWKAFARPQPIDLVITNPPFEYAFEIVQHAVTYAKRGVALLLRLTFLEPTEDRGPWLAVHPPERVIVLPRHDFRGNGSTDSVTSAWMLWSTDRDQPLGPKGIQVVSKAERDRLMVEAV